MLRHPQHAVDSVGQLLPVLGIRLELLSSRRSQSIETRAPSQFGDSPLGLDPALMLQPMQSRVKRTLIHFQDPFGHLFDSFGDVPAVFGIVLKSSKDEEVESALKKVEPAIGFHSVDVLHQLM